jgi:hypothetical protein
MDIHCPPLHVTDVAKGILGRLIRLRDHDAIAEWPLSHARSRVSLPTEQHSTHAQLAASGNFIVTRSPLPATFCIAMVPW